MKSAGNDYSPESQPTSGIPSSGVRESGAPLRVRRVCESCGVDLEWKPRSKNVDGVYRCMPCHKRRKTVRTAVQGMRRRIGRLGVAIALAVFTVLSLLGMMRSCNEPAQPPAESQ